MNHLDLFNKQQNPIVNIIILINPETQQMNLDTRLVQVDAAMPFTWSSGRRYTRLYRVSVVSCLTQEMFSSPR